jgi:iron complex transport system substrate-binding protein
MKQLFRKTSHIVMGAMLLALSSALLLTPVFAQETIAENPTACISDYNADVDYFPNKIEISNTDNFAVEYFNDHKTVTVMSGMGETQTMVLVQCGAPTPDDLPDDATVIEVPVQRTVALSTTQLPHLDILGVVDTLVGIDSFLYTNTESVRKRIEAGEVVELAPDFTFNLEVAIDAEADVVFTDDFDQERLAGLRDAGIAYALNVDYLEATPFARAEWLKYTSLFFNAEAEAMAFYDQLSDMYADVITEVRNAAADADSRPLVLWNTVFGDSWFLPGTETYIGALTADAEGDLVLADQAQFSTPFAFEAVYDAGLEADVWIANAYAVATLDDLLAQDERYGDFSAVSAGNVWNTDAYQNDNFGNNFYELGVIRPDLVLADLSALFYPEAFLDHEFVFFRPLQ